ncbi:ArsR/SmtB family transcription factor [Arsenicicoccus sp. oral taxon 190]|uniref:ArsR/SmtB family transcription factor n=1 Tax=Arsenicicoccus sp. oral taxon 190 TaxID=1658671 RepID=UPI00067A1AD6|nr:winged helix-turn-helix domain-containing protein [Arsenicicoccus sp. oral taxon 190]AKT51836.1 hypothetical protein ADJ73_12135 [Arsenicicoccus sp. oral taxon 190]
MTSRIVDVDLSVIGRALADPSRASMLTALMTGTAWTVGELATRAGIARSTASEHVHHLETAALVRLRRQGRHTYVTLAGPQVAAALESLSLLAPERPAPASLRGVRHARELTEGRTCYRHLAGRIGVALHDHLLGSELITPGYELTADGLAWFAERGVDPPSAGAGPRLRPCLDWTERRPHLAGPLAEGLACHAFAHRWIERGTHPRSIRLTPGGRAHLPG